eukprot:5492502-Pleurochrysis_carterae.AAC.1
MWQQTRARRRSFALDSSARWRDRPDAKHIIETQHPDTAAQGSGAQGGGSKMYACTLTPACALAVLLPACRASRPARSGKSVEDARAKTGVAQLGAQAEPAPHAAWHCAVQLVEERASTEEDRRLEASRERERGRANKAGCAQSAAGPPRTDHSLEGAVVSSEAVHLCPALVLVLQLEHLQLVLPLLLKLLAHLLRLLNQSRQPFQQREDNTVDRIRGDLKRSSAALRPQLSSPI